MPEQIKRAKAKRSRIHGTGLFATEDVPKGEKIIEYTGEKITKAEAVRRYEKQSEEGAIYLFDLNKRYDVDGAVSGNEAKFANHSCEPNAETIIERGRIWITAKRPIKKGEEILYDYNFPYFDHEKRPCHCGSEKCRGWIISKSAYYYKRRKDAESAKKGVRKKRPSKKSTSAPVPANKGKGAKKAAKKAAKKSGKKVAKTGQEAKKRVARPAKKDTRALARQASTSSGSVPVDGGRPEHARAVPREPAAHRPEAGRDRVRPTERLPELVVQSDGTAPRSETVEAEPRARRSF